MISNTITDPLGMQEFEEKLEQKRQAKFARRVLLERVQKSADPKATPVISIIYNFICVGYCSLLPTIQGVIDQGWIGSNK